MKEVPSSRAPEPTGLLFVISQFVIPSNFVFGFRHCRASAIRMIHGRSLDVRPRSLIFLPVPR